jgi:AmmeMemoRadiSam system protein B
MSFIPDSARSGEIASRVAGECGNGKTIVAVASTDLTHYGASVGLMPAGVGGTAVEWTRENDGRFLDALVGLDAEGIVPIAKRDQSACGAGAAAAAAGWARERGCRKGRLLAATNSHEVAPRGVAEHIVGYASVAYDV